MRSTATLISSQVTFVALLLLGWQWLGNTGRIDLGFVGTPSLVWIKLQEWLGDGSLLGHVASTMSVLLAGFLLATLLGAVLGVLISVSHWASEILEPFLTFFNGMPRLILQPFFVVWLGFAFAAKISLVVTVIVIMVVVNTAAAFKEVDCNIVDNTRLLGAGPRDLALHVYLPSLALALVSSARTTLGFALQATLVSEFVGAASGLGYLIVKGQQTFDVSAIWAALVVVVALSMILDTIVSEIEHRVTRWMPNPKPDRLLDPATARGLDAGIGRAHKRARCLRIRHNRSSILWITSHGWQHKNRSQASRQRQGEQRVLPGPPQGNPAEGGGSFSGQGLPCNYHRGHRGEARD